MMLNRLYPALRPLFFALEPERAHALALSALNHAHSMKLVRPHVQPTTPISLLGLSFPNRIGLAAGFDKNALHIDALGALGFGFIEVGTVTPKPQSGQAKPRLFRLQPAQALINRMGFPNDGSEAIAERLSRRTYRGVLGVNIGKNAATAMEDATRDYVDCFRVVAPHADYVAINVSSPNTKDLRRLQEVGHLRPMLEALLDERERLRAGAGHRVPLLVKISPDLTRDELVSIAELVRKLGLDGVIATNSTVSRAGTEGLRHADEAGGLSGAPLRPLALQAIGILRSVLAQSAPIIAAGGIDSGSAAADAIAAGADLVQIYTGLVYRGPGLLREIDASLHRAGTATGAATTAAS